MDYLVANVDHIEFKIERDLNEQFGALPLPFPGMDKSTAAVCQFFGRTEATGQECEQGASCPFRHIRGDRTIVCKHWLRGLCKKGDQCEFLHEYDMTKMPECYFYSRFNACHNKECPFLHIDPESKIRDCPWYDRGFCRHGPHCRHRHVRRVLCTNYLAGVCVDGPACKFMHPRFELPPPPEVPKDQQAKRPPVCHYCGELGHKASYCQNMPPEQREASLRQEEAKFRSLGYMRPINHHYAHHRQQKLEAEAAANAANAAEGGEAAAVGGAPAATAAEGGDATAAPAANSSAPPAAAGGGVGNEGGGSGRGEYVGRGGFMGRGRRPDRGPPRPLEEITCFKCGGKGHYANRCPKGHLAFLSNNHSYNQPPPSAQANQNPQHSGPPPPMGEQMQH